jgi:hypothetical protein
VANALVIFVYTLSDERTKFGNIDTWSQFYKTFLSGICEISKYARVFVPGKRFQPSPMFVGKAGNYLSEASFRVGSWAYPQTLDQSGKACQGQSVLLIMKIYKLQTKKFYNIGPWRQPGGARLE